MSKFAYQVNGATPHERAAIVKFLMLVAQAANPYGKETPVEEVIAKFERRHANPLYPVVYGDFTHFSGDERPNFIAAHAGQVITFPQLVQKFLDRQTIQTVKLNDKYTAEVTPDGISVGCQNFSFEKFAELRAAVDVVLSKK